MAYLEVGVANCSYHHAQRQEECQQTQELRCSRHTGTHQGVQEVLAAVDVLAEDHCCAGLPSVLHVSVHACSPVMDRRVHAGRSQAALGQAGQVQVWQVLAGLELCGYCLSSAAQVQRCPRCENFHAHGSHCGVASGAVMVAMVARWVLVAPAEPCAGLPGPRC